MTLVPRGDEWEIVGPEKERARLAYAVLEGNHVVYDLPTDSAAANRAPARVPLPG